jgi:NAD(P)-dependent dehydrogenase (short-subunit alcohol dehydrogenase family)
VARKEDVRSLVQKTVSELGGVDVLVNAAGTYGPIGMITDVCFEDWEAALRVNLLGTLCACQEVLPHMTARRRGSIVNFSGGGAASPLPRFSAYGVSKAAVVRLTETLAAEYRHQGVRVNAIAPGAVDTRLQDEVLQAGDRAGDLHARILALRTSGEGGTPVELPARLALFLASDDSGDLSGRLISAPHDPWREWTPERMAALGGTDWFTLRRIDPFTIEPLVNSRP